MLSDHTECGESEAVADPPARPLRERINRILQIVGFRRRAWTCCDKAIKCGSAEWLLKRHANGGTVIAFRTIWSATLIYLVALAIRERLVPGATWRPSLPHPDLIRETLHWYGAIIAGMYAGFYSRFASQWTYLANLYNQIMASAIQNSQSPLGAEASELAAWRAGFIEDAEDLHLATKPMFAAVVMSFLRYEGVREAFVKNTVDGASRLAQLETSCNRAARREEGVP